MSQTNASREANRKAKIAADPDYAARWREQRRQIKRRQGKAVAAERLKAAFVGVDGEGVRRDDGSSDYTLLRIGKRTLTNRGARLTTPQILDFVCNAPRDAILIGFALEYDFANWLRDVKELPKPDKGLSRLERILRIEEANAAKANGPRYLMGFWTWLDFDGYPPFGVNYLPRNHLKVCRGVRLPGRSQPVSDKASIRTVYDTFGNFQSSFLKALQDRGVGREHWAAIKEMKESRDEFKTMTAAHKRYNKIECELLCDLMDLFRADAIRGDIVPRTWNGAGKLAAAAHAKNGTFTTKEIAKTVPAGVLSQAHAAYYGGRFETTRAGLVSEPVHAHDINSAYPAAMDHLPCLKHGSWRKVSADHLREAPRSAIFVCPVRYVHRQEQFLCGLPHRDKTNRLSWRRRGSGVYWSPEIRSAERLGAKIEYRAGWLYQPRCTCNPFDWVKNLYAYRLSLEKDGAGYAVKLAINALYGKLAQRVGEPKWSNPIWAGLITARTRATLNDAIKSVGPRNVLMIATDAIFTVQKQAPVPIGEGLGKWSLKEYPQGIFIVRPGLYWTASKTKSRGVSVKFLRPQIPVFEREWAFYAKPKPDPYFRSPPLVVVETDVFIGLRLAYRRGDLAQACQWQTVRRKQSFEWTDKRALTGAWEGQAFTADAIQGDEREFSHAYAPPKDGLGLPDGAEDWQKERMLFEAMPDASAYLAAPG